MSLTSKNSNLQRREPSMLFTLGYAMSSVGILKAVDSILVKVPLLVIPVPYTTTLSHLLFQVDWLTALRHISTERLLVPRDVAKEIWSRFVDKYNCVWRNADWPASWDISTKRYQWQWKCGCSLTSCPRHHSVWMQFSVMPRTMVGAQLCRLSPADAHTVALQAVYGKIIRYYLWHCAVEFVLRA